MEQDIVEKKKLLIATDNFLPRWDGIARFLSETIPRLSAHYAITVVAPDFGTYEDPNIALVKIPLTKHFSVGDFRIAKSQPRVIAKLVKDADLVFTQTIGTIGSLAIRAAHHQKKPVVAFIHSIEWELAPKAMSNVLLKKYVQLFAKRVAKKLYNSCDLLIMPSGNVAELYTWNGVRTASEIVNLGVDTDKFRPVDEAYREQIRAQLGIKPTDIVIGYHGRISREKDPITLLRAFTRIQQHGYYPVKLLIVGEGIESIKKQLAARKDVILVGGKNNPVPYLHAMDIYCLSSLTETTCLSVLEAMACELPVISTEVGFIKSYIKNGVNGLFFEKQQPYHLAQLIIKLAIDEKLRKSIGTSARQTIVTRFSWDKTAEGIEHALGKVLGKKKR